MVVYYINKVSDRLSDYRYPIKEGDICMLYDGETVKTIYIDSERDTDSIWRDFKFIDSKSLKSYQFPTSDSILCAPIGEKNAMGNTGLLTQLIKECKGEWLLDFLKETSSILSGFVDYWDLEVLRRLTGDDEVKITYEEVNTISEFVDGQDENEIDKEEDDFSDDEDDFMPSDYNIRWFCLSVLTCVEDQLDNRSYLILYDTLRGISRKSIAEKHHLTQERIRQIVVKATKQAKELLIEQRAKLEKEIEDNAKLKVQINLLRDDIADLKALLPKELLPQQRESNGDLDAELVELLETPLDDIALSARACNILFYMGVKKFVEIPQIENSMQLLKVRNSGRKTVYDVSCILADFHLTFGLSYTEIIDILLANDWHKAKRKWMRDGKKKETKEHNDVVKQESVVMPLVRNVNDSQDDIGNVKPEEATIVLTEDIIEAARTPNGGFTKSQLAAIGIAWPPPLDWIKEKVGTKITLTQLKEFKHIKYIKEPSLESSKIGGKNYKDVAFNSQDERRMEAILQAMTDFLSPVTPMVIACTIDSTAWGNDEVNVDIVDSILKRLPEVKYVKWGKYILKSRTTPQWGSEIGE